MIKLAQSGWLVHDYVCTNGQNAFPNKKETISDLTSIREKETKLFCKKVGAQPPKVYQQKGSFLEVTDEAILDLVAYIRKVQPSVIAIMHEDDYHFEHKKSRELALVAIEESFRRSLVELGRPIKDAVILETDGLNVLTNPLISFDISDVHNKKTEACMDAYGKRLGNYLLRFDQGLNQMRGARVKTDYAEAYGLVNPSWYKFTAQAAQNLSDFTLIGSKNLKI